MMMVIFARRSEFLVEAARLCQMDHDNVARVLALTEDPARLVLEHGDTSRDLKTFLRQRASHTLSSTDSPTRLTSSPSRSATAALRSHALRNVCHCDSAYRFCVQCFDAVGWAAGRASGL